MPLAFFYPYDIVRWTTIPAYQVQVTWLDGGGWHTANTPYVDGTTDRRYFLTAMHGLVDVEAFGAAYAQDPVTLPGWVDPPFRYHTLVQDAASPAPQTRSLTDFAQQFGYNFLCTLPAGARINAVSWTFLMAWTAGQSFWRGLIYDNQVYVPTDLAADPHQVELLSLTSPQETIAATETWTRYWWTLRYNPFTQARWTVADLADFRVAHKGGELLHALGLHTAALVVDFSEDDDMSELLQGPLVAYNAITATPDAGLDINLRDGEELRVYHAIADATTGGLVSLTETNASHAADGTLVTVTTPHPSALQDNVPILPVATSYECVFRKCGGRTVTLLPTITDGTHTILYSIWGTRQK